MKKTSKNIVPEIISKATTEIILSFCENLAEIGMPKNATEADMWYRYLSPKEQNKVARKLIKIIMRRSKEK